MTHAMRANFGLSLSTRAVLFDWGTLDDLIDAAQMAEASGYFDSIWVVLSKPRVEAIVTLSALAARTERVRIGTICLASFPLHKPILLALQWASLDVLATGRTILAVCNGALPSMVPNLRMNSRSWGYNHANGWDAWSRGLTSYGDCGVSGACCCGSPTCTPCDPLRQL